MSEFTQYGILNIDGYEVKSFIFGIKRRLD